MRGIITTLVTTLGVLTYALPTSAQETDPILCVNAVGHTAGVRALVFSADSKRLYSAGMDKVVQVWSFPDFPRPFPSSTKGAFIEPWGKDLPIRWEIARGLRGCIYCLALHPRDEVLAIGGYGARGTAGEIIRVDPRDGMFQSPYAGHAQSVWGIAFSTDGRWLASIDLAGLALVWHQNAKEPLHLTRPDCEACEKAVLDHLAARPYRPIAAVGSDMVALPHCFKTDGGIASEILLYRAADGQQVRAIAWPGAGTIRAMAATADGRYLAAVCDRGDLCLWDLNPDAGKMPTLLDAGRMPTLRRLQQSLPGISLAFSADGTILLVGTAVRPETSASDLQVWDVPKHALRHTFPLKEAVYACAVSPDGKRIAYSGAGGNDIVLRPLDGPGEALLLRGGQQIVRAAFLRKGGQVASGTKRRQDTYATGYAFLCQPATSRRAGGECPGWALFPASSPAGSFPPSAATGAKQFDPLVLQPPERVGGRPAETSQAWGDWRGELQREKNGVQIFYRNEAKGFVRLDAEKQGILQTFCWIPDENGQAEAIALGSDLQCGVYLFGLNSPGQAPLRYYRGHHDAVTSLDVSGDRKYLLSASRDGTVRYWRLAGYRDGPATAPPLGRRHGGSRGPPRRHLNGRLGTALRPRRAPRRCPEKNRLAKSPRGRRGKRSERHRAPARTACLGHPGRFLHHPRRPPTGRLQLPGSMATLACRLYDRRR